MSRPSDTHASPPRWSNNTRDLLPHNRPHFCPEFPQPQLLLLSDSPISLYYSIPFSTVRKHYCVGNIKFSTTKLQMRMKTKYTCYFFKYIQIFITGLCLFTPVEERIAGETSPFPGSRQKAIRPNVTLTSRNTTWKQTAKFSKSVSRPHLQTVLRQHFRASSKDDDTLPA